MWSLSRWMWTSTPKRPRSTRSRRCLPSNSSRTASSWLPSPVPTRLPSRRPRTSTSKQNACPGFFHMIGRRVSSFWGSSKGKEELVERGGERGGRGGECNGIIRCCLSPTTTQGALLFFWCSFVCSVSFHVQFVRGGGGDGGVGRDCAGGSFEVSVRNGTRNIPRFFQAGDLFTQQTHVRNAPHHRSMRYRLVHNEGASICWRLKISLWPPFFDRSARSSEVCS